jgi:lipopolysaccharide transport system permease protein
MRSLASAIITTAQPSSISRMKKIIRVYSPKRSAFTDLDVWNEMLVNLWGSRELILRLAHRDYSVRYRQSVLGYVWAVAPQIITVAIFAFLARYRVFDMGQPALPYLVHALWSISVWQLFSVSLVNCTNSLITAGSLVTKINFPKESLVIASTGKACIDFAIRLIPVIAVMWWVGFTPSLSSLLIPLILLLVLLLAIGVGFILSVVNLVIRDMGNMVSMVMTFGMFLAPILYPPPVTEPFLWVNILNPFSPMLISTQELLAGAPLSHPVALGVTAFLAIAAFLVGWRVFCITMPRVSERA